MVKIALYFDKSLEENASIYYERSKKIKKKLEGAKRALQNTLKKLEEAKKTKIEPNIKKIVNKPKKWYEKFRWFISSEGFLVVGGRDATTNEILIKKYTSAKDLVFHTDLRGGPFFVIKSDNKDIGKATIEETACATSTFSKAWKLGLKTTPVFYVKPEQVTKKAKAGEYLSKGAFMIYGKTTYVDNIINLAIGITDEGKIMAGPLRAIKKNCKRYIEIKQGRKKKGEIAKYIQKRLGGDLDEIIRALPAGGCEIKK